MSGEHSIIPPSSAFRRALCTGSAMMEMMHPQTEQSAEAMEGDAAHELSAQSVYSASRGGLIAIPHIGDTMSNGVEVTAEMEEAVGIYVADVRTVMQRTRCFNPQIEQRTVMPMIHEQSWGTPDCTLWHDQERTLYVWDFKYGHRVVEAFENWQMIEYAAGRLNEILGSWPPSPAVQAIAKIVLTVVQPRAFHRDGMVRRWHLSAGELVEYVKRAQAFEHMALNDAAYCVAGAVQCRDCSARYNCETLAQSAASWAQYAGEPVPQGMTPQQQGIELAMLREAEAQIEARRTGIEAALAESIKMGETGTGWALEPGRGSTVWTVDKQEVICMGDLMGIDLRAEEKLVTPKQAIGLGIDASVIKQYSEQQPGAVSLVKADSTLASRVFGKKKEQ